MKVIGDIRTDCRNNKVWRPGAAAIHLQSGFPYKAVLMRETPIKKTVTPIAQGRHVCFQIDHSNYNLDRTREIWVKRLE